MESIMPTTKGVCYICGAETHTESHHIFFGTANRRISEREGLKVWLCHECHRSGKHAVHRCRATDINLRKEAQEVWETKYKRSYTYENHEDEAAREEFRRLFGRSYL